MAKQTQTELVNAVAERCGCTASTVWRWKKAGAPIADEKALSEWLDSRRSTPEAAQSKPLTQARIDKLKIETQRAIHELAVRRGLYALQSDVDRDVIAIGRRMQAVLLRIPGEAGNLEGLAAHDIEKRLSRCVDDVLAVLGDAKSYAAS